jgi:hypothetical protein
VCYRRSSVSGRSLLVFCPHYLFHAAIKSILLLVFYTEASDDVSFVQAILSVCVGAGCARKK